MVIGFSVAAASARRRIAKNEISTVQSPTARGRRYRVDGRRAEKARREREAFSKSSRMPPRLARLDRLYVRTPIYFVTACTVQRRRLLACPEIQSAFVRFAERGQELGAWIGVYALMPDHLHLFVALDDERITLSRWVRALKGVLSHDLRQMGVAAPHWQKGFFDHVLRSDESASQKWEYVRDNPVRAGLVATWDQWPYAGEIFPLEYRSDNL
jgi:REP element-mobilizing transposase RayT